MSLEIITQTDWAAVASTIVAICTSITTVIGGIIAAVQKLKADHFAEEIQETQAFFDPENNEVMTPTSRTPDRSWMMGEETKAYIINGLEPEDRISALTQISEAEANGYVDYKIVVGNGYYSISYGLIIGGVAPTGKAPAKAFSSAPGSGILMKEAVFDVMTAAETDEWKAKIRNEMAAKDAIGDFPYIINSDKATYTIRRALDENGNDYTDQYGTQYVVTYKHK